MKLLLMVLVIFSFNSHSQETGRLLTDDISGGGGRRIMDDISGGGGKIALLNLERISGSEDFQLKDARPAVNRILEVGDRADMSIRMMKLKVLADFKDILEITLKDGTVLKADQILKGE